MKLASSIMNYDFKIDGVLIKKFEFGKTYVMSDHFIHQILEVTGKAFLTNIKEMDKKVYREYNGEDLDGKTIVIWRTGGMGDLCFITPLLRKIKQLYPTCKIIFGCAIQYADVLSEHDCVDEFHNLPIDTEVLRKSDYHLMFEGIIESSKKAETINAYDLFEENFKLKTKLTDEEKTPNLPVNKESLQHFFNAEEKLFKDFKIDMKKGPIRIGVQLKTSSIVRNVPIEKLIKVMYMLLEINPRIVFYLLGSQEDADAGSKIPTSEARGRIIPFYQVTRLFRDTVAAISSMDCVLGGDSSAIHIASAFEVPVVGLYGAFRSSLRMKYYENAIGIDSSIKCSPCFLHGNESCDNSDMNGISLCMHIFNPENIVREILLLLTITKKIGIDNVPPVVANMAIAAKKEYNLLLKQYTEDNANAADK